MNTNDIAVCASAWTHQTELASIVQSTPLIADALHTRAVAPIEHRR